MTWAPPCPSASPLLGRSHSPWPEKILINHQVAPQTEAHPSTGVVPLSVAVWHTTARDVGGYSPEQKPLDYLPWCLSDGSTLLPSSSPSSHRCRRQTFPLYRSAAHALDPSWKNGSSGLGKIRATSVKYMGTMLARKKGDFALLFQFEGQWWFYSYFFNCTWFPPLFQIKDWVCPFSVGRA